jgi:hypothetical protein
MNETVVISDSKFGSETNPGVSSAVSANTIAAATRKIASGLRQTERLFIRNLLRRKPRR